MGNAFGSQVTVKEWCTSQRARQRFHDDAVTWFHDMSSPHSIAKDFVKAHPRFRNVLWFLEIFFLAATVALVALVYIVCMYAFVTFLLYSTGQNVPASVFVGLCLVLLFINFVKRSLVKATNQTGYT